MADATKYRAFISYSHADEAWARWIHQKLERYRVPSRLVGRSTSHGAVPRRIGRCFRDQAELSAASQLGETLQQALRDSQCLIVVCSPRSASSHWVNEEIEFFRSLDKGNSVFALIVDGEPHAKDAQYECFPPALREGEPLAADARDSADGKSDGFLKLAAGVLGVGFDELRQRERRRRTRLIIATVAASLSVAAATTILAISAYVARNEARSARDLAERRQQQAEDLLEFMIGDLRSKLEPIGKLSILDAVGKKAMDYFATDSDDKGPALGSRAKVMFQIGEVREKQGDLDGAADAYLQAFTLNQQRVSRDPADAEALNARALSEFGVGSIYMKKNAFDQANLWHQRYVATAEALARAHPDEIRWQSGLAEAHEALGATHYYAHEPDEARKQLEIALPIGQRVLEQQPDRPEFLLTMLEIESVLWALAHDEGDYEKALQYAQAEEAIAKKRSALDPDDANLKNLSVQASLTVLETQRRLRVTADNDSTLLSALGVAEELVKLDPDNTEYLRNLDIALGYSVNAFAASGNIASAKEADQRMLAISRSLYQRAPGNTDAIDGLIEDLEMSAELALLLHDVETAQKRLKEARGLPLTPEQTSQLSAGLQLRLALLDWRMGLKSSQAMQLKAAAEKWMEKRSASGPVNPELAWRFEALSGHAAAAAEQFRKMPPGQQSSPLVRDFCQALKAC